ncbi:MULTISPECIES: serine/threonine-protein kinase [Rhodococcus]|uniref:serine/threonine-protein kinase n=1 Tax=Rhodococcus TaxID=1827 RepID=UPI000C9D19AA|nr:MULTISPECIES: serine/threonine-protein kinase [Rhodococcus]PND53124.1 protein kinase [Rhodococcus sp. ENV425]WKW96391.1 protein kinase [Rhodococcus aetherivorans]
MAESDPLATQRETPPRIVAELVAAGFEDVHEIGRGGFGVVYRCRQPALDRTVAIKVLTSEPDPDNLERFLREQRAMGRLSGHPNIVTVHEVGATASGQPYIVMEYHRRNSLEARIREQGPLRWEDALGIGVKIAGALETAHRMGMLHRDVKPANILLTDYGEPQLTDFGIARVAGAFETAAGAVTGSPAFTAPEVLAGQSPSRSADVYGLGATLFCAITGHAAYERRRGESVVAQFLRITRGPAPDLHGGTGIPDDVGEMLERAMDRDPTSRTGTAAAFGEQLRAVEEHHGLPVDELPVPDASEPTDLGAAHPRATTGTGRRRRTGSGRLTPPVPATRLRPPTATRPLVVRERLLRLLRVGGRRILTAITAPPGFGKTTLAAQWSRELADNGVQVAWLSVDSDDNGAVRLLAHLLESLRQVRPALAQDLGAVLEEYGDDATQYVLTALINEIQESEEHVALIIDDWHRVSDSATIAAMAYLLDNADFNHLQIIVTSQARTGLPLSRMRLRAELIEVDAATLRFDPPEVRRLLVELAGLRLTDNDVDALTRATGGWVAALQLVSLSLRDSDDPAGLIRGITGRHHVIGEYLAENVLDTLEPRILEFLLATCICEYVSAELATVLTGTTRCQSLLEEIEDRGLFLRRMDEDRTWFRYHHLFREFLQRRIERETPERVTQLHRTAAQWFAEHAIIRDAVTHAQAAGDQEMAVDLVERHGASLLEHSQVTSTLALLDKLPPAVLSNRPRLQLMVAWTTILLNRVRPAEQALEAVESLLTTAPLTADETEDLRAEVGVVRAVVAARCDRFDTIDELVRPSLARADSLSPWVVSAAANLASMAAIYRFDFDATERLQEWAAPYHARNHGPYAHMHSYCCLGLAAHERLDIATAEERFRQGLRVSRSRGDGHSLAARLAASLLGELLYEQDRLDEAERLLDEAYLLGYEGGAVDFKVARYAIGARIKAVRGDRAAAAQRLDAGARAAHTLTLPRLRARIEEERVRLRLPPTAGIPPRPPIAYPERRRPVHGVDAITAQLDETVAIWALLDDDTPASTELACTWAQEWVDILADAGRPRALLQARRLLVDTLAAADRADEAKELLATITAQCATLGIVRYLLDGGPHLVALLADLRADWEAGRWRDEWPAVPDRFWDAVTPTEP